MVYLFLYMFSIWFGMDVWEGYSKYLLNEGGEFFCLFFIVYMFYFYKEEKLVSVLLLSKYF